MNKQKEELAKNHAQGIIKQTEQNPLTKRLINTTPNQSFTEKMTKPGITPAFSVAKVDAITLAKCRHQTNKHLNDSNSILRTPLLLESLLNEIDELSNQKIYRQSLKQKGKAFLSELEKVNNIIFMSEDEQSQSQAFELVNSLERIDNSLKKIHYHYLDEIAELLEYYVEHGKGATQTRVEEIANRQYAKLGEFMLPKGILTQLKKLIPGVEQTPILQVSQEFSKDQLIKQKGIGEETISFLDRIFMSANIKW